MNPIAALIVIGALAGHVTLAVAAINCLYGTGWPRWRLKCVRAVHDVWQLVGTPVVAWHALVDGYTSWAGWVQPGFFTAYLASCAAVGLVVVPAITIRLWLRRLPDCQLSNHSRLVDVAAELGRKPIGSGPQRLLARVPFNEQFTFEVNERIYRLARVPAEWDGLSILHLSDFHFSGTVAVEYFERLVDEANRLDCDLVALTGDFVEKPWCHDWVPRVLGRLRWRVGGFAVLGNHDAWRDHERTRRDLAAAGYELVAGRWLTRPVRGLPLVVAGTEQPWMGTMPDMAAAPRDVFRLLLSHTPDCVPFAMANDFDLMLAGHNHAGQVQLPVVGPVFMPSRFGRRFDKGAFQIGPTLLHVSRGISGAHPLRVRARPEVTKLILRSPRCTTL